MTAETENIQDPPNGPPPPRGNGFALTMVAIGLVVLALYVVKTRQELASLAGRISSPSTPIASASTTAIETNRNSNAAVFKALDEIMKTLDLLSSNQQDLYTRASSAKQTDAEAKPSIDQVKGIGNDLIYLRSNLQALANIVTGLTNRHGVTPALSVQLTELNRLKARLAALEAKPEPYSADELVLLPAPKSMVKPAAGKPNLTTEQAMALSKISQEADAAFKAGQFGIAEQKYQEITRFDSENVINLSNLAAAQLELNKLSAAETNLARALGVDQNDAASLSLLGLVKLRQSRLDEALDLLSRSALLDPRNAKVQNYLGLVLIQKGQRKAAETAFREAVKLAPDYPVAHYNLAVYYATAKPPLPRLGDYHYQKAISGGQPKDVKLEVLLGH